MRKASFQSLFPILIVFVSVTYAAVALAFSEADTRCPAGQEDKGWFVSEQWILMELSKGHEVDLALCKMCPSHYVSSSFLQYLLTQQDVPIPHRGLVLKHLSVTECLDLTNVTVPYDLSITDSNFQGTVIFIDAVFRRNLELSRNSFQAVSLNRAKINGSWFMRQTSFRGPLSAIYSDIDGSFVVDKSTFYDLADFNSMKVGKTFRCHRCSFYANVDFRATHIGSNYDAFQSKYYGDTSRVSFNSMKLAGHANLIGAFFHGFVDFRFFTTGGNLNLSDAEFLCASIPGSKLEAATEQLGTVDFRGTRVGQALWLINTRVCGDWRFLGANYEFIYADNMSAEENWAKLKRLLRSTSFSSEIYVKVEEFFRKSGYPDISDAVFIEQKERERGRLKALSKLGNLTLLVLVGQGRYPSLALIWSACFVLLGVFVFRRESSMEVIKSDRKPPRYSAFWYSLDLFLPLSRLHAADIWAPKRSRTYAWVYMRLHQLIGWILIPLGVASITGLIK